MATILSTKIILRNDTAANWLKYNPVLQAGELGIENDTGLFKIGNGEAAYADLPYANKYEGGTALVADEKTIATSADGIIGLNKWGQEYYRYVEGGTYELQIVDADHPWKEGLMPRVAVVDGETQLAWYEPSTQTVEEMAQAIETIQNQISNITTSVEGMLPLAGGTMLGDLVLADGSNAASENYVDDKIEAFASAITDNGKVDTLVELINWVEDHGTEVADMTNSISNLEKLVGEVSVEERISILDKASRARFEHKKYEIVSMPPETLVNYYDKEIRVMCPANTVWTKQNVGPTGNANQYYLGFKAYAPENAYSFKEDLGEIITDNTMWYFENNDFAGIDSYGRKYSIVWLAAAIYDEATDTWKYYGADSTKEKMLGFYYTVEWYDKEGKKINSDLIRINLSNEQCHSTVEPYYMGKVVKEVQVNGVAAPLSNNSVNITVQDMVKNSEEISVNEDNSLTINQISITKVNADDTTLILNGGGAAAN